MQMVNQRTSIIIDLLMKPIAHLYKPEAINAAACQKNLAFIVPLGVLLFNWKIHCGYPIIVSDDSFV